MFNGTIATVKRMARNLNAKGKYFTFSLKDHFSGEKTGGGTSGAVLCDPTVDPDTMQQSESRSLAVHRLGHVFGTGICFPSAVQTRNTPASLVDVPMRQPYLGACIECEWVTWSLCSRQPLLAVRGGGAV